MKPSVATLAAPETIAAQETSRDRLMPGYHLFETSEEGWLLYEPGGAFVRLHAPSETLRALAEHLADRSDADRDADGAETGPAPMPNADLVALLDRFAERGVIAPRTSLDATVAETACRSVRMVGGGPVAQALRDLLAAEDGLEVSWQETARPEAAEGADLVVACSGWLPDSSWQALDEVCRQHGIAWHGCHAEGDKFYLGPFWSPDNRATASYRDVRARRLAAAPFPEGLEGYWRHIDRGVQLPAVEWPDAGSIAALAGTLAADILAWARGRQPPSRGYQIAFAPATGTWHRHPVLPVPRGLMTEGTGEGEIGTEG